MLSNDMQAVIRAKLLYHEDLLSRILNDKQHSTTALEQMARIIAEALQHQVVKDRINSMQPAPIGMDWRTEPPSERRASMLKNAGA